MGFFLRLGGKILALVYFLAPGLLATTHSGARPPVGRVARLLQMVDRPARISAVPQINLHEFRAPKRVAAVGSRQPGPARPPPTGLPDRVGEGPHAPDGQMGLQEVP